MRRLYQIRGEGAENSQDFLVPIMHEICTCSCALDCAEFACTCLVQVLIYLLVQLILIFDLHTFPT